MGKNLVQQARGKGGPSYRAPSFKYKGKAKVTYFVNKPLVNAQIKDIVHCAGHSAPLVETACEGKTFFMIAPEGVKVGDALQIGADAAPVKGNVLPLSKIPEGSSVFNIEAAPGDGGKFVRSSGGAAKVVTKSDKEVIVVLPSKRTKSFNVDCRATIGVCAGGGRPEKPLIKAGAAFYKMKAKNKKWPTHKGCALNAVDHPFGCKRTSRKGRPTIAPHNAPPGRKVGMIRPRQTGRKTKAARNQRK